MSLIEGITLGGMIAVTGIIFGIGVWKGKVDSDRTSFKEFMREVRDDIKELLSRTPVRVVQGGSPLRLTELGEAISQDLDAPRWADGLVPELKEQVAGKLPYEIQEISLEHVRALRFSDEERRAVQQIAYDNAITEEQVRDVVAIVLRDKLLELQKEQPPG